MPTSVDEIVTPVKLIREADRDREVFELRDITGIPGVMRFTFDEDIAEEVLDAFQDGDRVKVVGVESRRTNLYHALLVERFEG